MTKLIFNDILQKSDGILKGPFGGDIKKAYFVPKGKNTYKIYEQGVVYDKDVNYGTYYINQDRFNRLRKFSVLTGDLLLTGAGTLGELFEIPENHEEGIINQALIRLRLNESIIDKDYFKYYFKWYIKNVVCRINGDSVIPNLPPISVLKKTEIDIPDLSTQKRISKTLKCLDDKIITNNAINAELEALAKTIYDYWFLQFEFPNEEGLPYKSSGGRMVWSEELKREIPEGWEVTSLSQHITSSRGISYNGEQIIDDGVPMINLNSFNPDSSYKIKGIKTFSGEYPPEKILRPYDLVMCNTQQTALDPKKDIIGKALLIPDIFNSDVVYSHHITRIDVDYENLKYYLVCLFNTNYFHKYISGYVNGTSIMGLIFDGVMNHKIPHPPKDLLDNFASFMKDIEMKKSNIIRENHELAALRDWLLPMLMNGQVGFKE